MHFSTYTGSSANFNEKNCMQQYTYCIVLFTRNACKRYICRHVKQISFCLGLRMGEEMNWNGHGKIFTVMEIPKTGMWCWLYNSKQWKSFCTHLQWLNLGICLYFVYIFYFLCIMIYVSISSVQSLSHVQLFVTPWTAACQASLSFTNSGAYSNSCLLSQWWRSFWLRRDCLSLG